MGSIVAGSTYLLAPPPKSHGHNQFIASILCNPIVHPHLLLQLQRKDPDTRHAFPQFDLVCRRSGRLSRKDMERNSQISPVHNGRRPRELAIQQSETGQRIAVVQYVNSLSSAQKRKLGIAGDDHDTIAVVYWNYRKSIVKEWTVHKYESKKGGRSVGYEFRLRGEAAGTKGFVSARWTRKISTVPEVPASPAKERPRSVSSRNRPNGSLSPMEGPRRQQTFASTPTAPSSTPEAKWEFSSTNPRRVMATMTSQKLHIHSLASNTTPLSSSSSSDYDEECRNDRELTSGRKLEFLIVSGLLVGLEEDFASELRKEFLAARGLRTPLSGDDIIPDVPIIKSPRKKHANSHAGRSPTLPVVEEPPLPTTPPPRVVAQLPSNDSSDTQESKSVTKTTSSTSHTPSLTPDYVLRGWGIMTSAASACVTKLMSLAA